MVVTYQDSAISEGARPRSRSNSDDLLMNAVLGPRELGIKFNRNTEIEFEGGHREHNAWVREVLDLSLVAFLDALLAGNSGPVSKVSNMFIIYYTKKKWQTYREAKKASISIGAGAEVSPPKLG